MLGPQCIECDGFAVLTSGAMVYLHNVTPERAERPVWRCPCGAYVGCHKGSTEPLGRPAGKALRDARIRLHARLDPIWRDAYEHINPGGRQLSKRRQKKADWLRRLARRRVYEFLADQLGLTEADCHIAMFDLPTCRRAWRVLDGLTYEAVREWVAQKEGREPGASWRPKSREETPKEGSAAPEGEAEPGIAREAAAG